jgi:hypothetical protein
MTSKRAIATPPPELGAASEANSFLAKFKTSLAKKWSVKGMATLYEIADLVAFLHALSRNEEAMAVADSVVTAVPAPPPLPSGGYNYNIWCPATLSHAFIAHLAPPHLSSRAAASRAALLNDPGIARDNEVYIARRIADAASDAANEVPVKPTKAQRQETARHLSTAVLYSVLGNAGDDAFAIHRELADGLVTSLRERLGRLIAGPGA